MSEPDLLLDAARRGIRYREGIASRAAQPAAEAIAQLKASFHGPLPEAGLAPQEVLRRLDEEAGPATVASTGGRYFGFVVGGSLPVATAANWLAAAWDQNAALSQMSPAAAHLDAVALQWAGQALRLPEPIDGGLVTGATTANIVALAAARTALLAKLGWDVEAQGLYGAPELKLVVGQEVHDSVKKALMVLGLGHARVTVVPADAEGRMRAEALPPLDAQTIVCTQVGHVHTGAFDPVGAIVDKAEAAGAWVHVDGAFGLWARASRRMDALTEGVERADSWCTDAHKWLNLPYDSGLVFTRHGPAMKRAMSAWAPLLSEERQPAAYTLEQSRRARGVDMWAALASLGREGLAALVEDSCAHARALAEGCRRAGGEIPHELVLNQLLVSFGSEARTEAVCRALAEAGAIGATPGRWRGERYLGLSVSSWATRAEDIEAAVQAIAAAVAKAG